ncbi:ferritin-like domain-containing protein [Anaeromicropila populeti]|uniref:Rubrerythrin n=1 Tax=Anaeromicropila populeti TaxID=37658 RepID=A0A1I6IRR2_9FIRM|nr:ferritin-like domain-containing protein [Anaeromicropila populeti]SFR69321.1 Rubrerythrin [Anaeromicropila populeti]
MFIAPCQSSKLTDNAQLRAAIAAISDAVGSEKEDELFYDYLLSQAPTEEEVEIITSIRDDERKHNKLFRRIYYDFTGNEIGSQEEVDFEMPESYVDGIRRALFGELAAVEKYRIIRSGLPMGAYQDTLFDIITDEIKHASKYNYLFTLNQGMNQPVLNAMDMDRTKFTPDDWVNYIMPLAKRALQEAKQGINQEHLFQEFILAGVLVGLGKSPEDAIDQVEQWEKTGASQILAMSKLNGISRK